MSSTSTVTWAIPVEACLLGARLEAYVESKATISTLRLCAKKGNPSEAPLAKLPQELTEEIVKHVQHPLIEKKLQEWKDMTYCLEGKCQYLRGHKNDHSLNHHVRLDRHISKLSRQTQQSEEGERFAKCRKIFTQDFGLEIDFDIFHDCDHDYTTDDFHRVLLQGYITLPSLRLNTMKSGGPGVTSYLASRIIEPSLLALPTMKQKALFQTAMRAFQLKPIPQEDGEGEDPLYLNPPRLAIAEQSSHACDTLGCPACSDFAVDLRCHRFKIHGEHLPSIGKSPKGSDGNHRAPSGQSMRLILPESAAVNSKTEEWPKLMYLSSGLLAAGQRYNNNGDDEFIYDSDGNTINGSDDD